MTGTTNTTPGRARAQRAAAAAAIGSITGTSSAPRPVARRAAPAPGSHDGIIQMLLRLPGFAWEMDLTW